MVQLAPVRGKLKQNPGQVVTCMIGNWNVLYHMHYNYTRVGLLWNMQRRLQHIKYSF